MATNKERIENLEVGLGQLQEDLSKMERGLSDELQQIKAAITKFSELSLTSKDASSSISNRISQNLTNQEESRDGGRPLVSAKLAKLEFPKYSGDDPTEWFTRVDQFFEYQGTPDSEKWVHAQFHQRKSGRITQIIGRTNQTLQRESSKWGSSSMQWKIQKYSSSLARYTLLNYVLFLANHGFGCGIRGTVAAAIGDSPMQLGQVDYGFYLEWGAATPARHPPGVPRYEGGHSPIHEVDQTLQTRDEILRELKSHLSRAANQMKQYVDLKRRDVEFQVGDHVYLKLQPYRQQSVSKRASQKLASRYFGPYRVLERVGKLAYKLELPAGSKVHPVFHVSLLKQHIGDTFPVSDVLPLLSDDVKPFWNQQQYWIQGGFVEGLEPFKKVWFYGNICHRRMLPGKIQLNYSPISESEP
ncbi:hypothetical protein GH714_039451 [Hevea brasiliensis]|uniref:Tf2-1-like SH3-like domain-containing protein n=1 Tax=Hevea brasiliensis TaxID=3981 RepID=A0A6A6M600_HEVBR|nr:hypothetical protein GH714_039451 [Hevea brasiliensis]